MDFKKWLRLKEAGAAPAPAGGGGGGGEGGGGMGVPGTPFPDGQKPSDSKALGPNKNKLDNSGISGGPAVRKGSGGGAAPAAAPAAPPK